MKNHEWFAARFRKQGTSARAAGEKAYLKSALRFHGVTSAHLKEAAKEWLRVNPKPTRRELRELVASLYETDWFDLRSVGLVVLEKSHKLLLPADADWLLSLVRKSQNWAQVDHIATRLLGQLELPKAKVRRWARDRDFWVRRTALLSLLLPMRGGGGDFELFAELAEPMLEEKEFFIRKAIGWILREVSKKRPQLVYEFLRKHRARLSGLTFREGSRRLPVALVRNLANL